MTLQLVREPRTSTTLDHHTYCHHHLHQGEEAAAAWATKQLQAAIVGVQEALAGGTRGGELGGGGGFGQRGFGGSGATHVDPLATLKSAIATAQAVGTVDEAMLKEAKMLLATRSMERRGVTGLRAAIEVAEGTVDVDRAVVEVSGRSTRTFAVNAIHARCARWTHSPATPPNHVCRRRRRCC